jgi:anthraniloyl-CoA monooxygenase
LANPAWTLTEAARIGFKDIAWPRAYVSGKPQLEAGFARERAMQTATKGD